MSLFIDGSWLRLLVYGSVARMIGFLLPCVLIRRVFHAASLRLRLIWVTEYVSLRFSPVFPLVLVDLDFLDSRPGILAVLLRFLCLVLFVMGPVVLFVVLFGVLLVLFVG